MISFRELEATLAAASGVARTADMLREAFAADPNSEHAEALVRYALNEDVIRPELRGLGREDQIYLHNLGAIREFLRAAVRETVSDVGEEFDFLGQQTPVNDWSLLAVVNLLAMRRIRPTRQVAAFVIVRDEGITLPEWIAHHRAIGVEEIFVFTNDNRDGSDGLLAALAQAGVIRLLLNKQAAGTNPQFKAYQYATQMIPELRRFEWLLVTDADEFLIPGKQYDYNLGPMIAAVRQRLGTELPAAVLFPWKWRLTDREFKRGRDRLLRRYPHAIPHVAFKAMVRPNGIVSMRPVHLPEVEPEEVIVDTSFEPIPPERYWERFQKSAAGGHIEHYWSKSFEEFAVKKQRGDALAARDNAFKRDYELYFQWTAPLTPENLDPVPEVVIDRMQQALTVLLTNPGIATEMAVTESEFDRLSRALEGSAEFMALYLQMREAIKPILTPAPERPRIGHPPIVHVQAHGGLGSQMMQLMAAMAISAKVPGCTISGVRMPEWGIDYPGVVRGEEATENSGGRALHRIDIDAAADALTSGRITRFEIVGPANHVDNFLPRDAYAAVFRGPDDAPGFDERVLLCNVRGADIWTCGNPDSTVLPVAFYEHLVMSTGLRPVFMGQMYQTPYIDALRARFPNAEFIDSRGPARDFALIRKSCNVVAAVSRYSWVAAWLSEAKRVFLPMSGFLNPFQKPEMNLLPLDDPRYRFYLFPINYALSANSYEAGHRAMTGLWREMTPWMIRQMRSAYPRFGNYYKSMLASFDETYYLARYPDIRENVLARRVYISGREHYRKYGYDEGRYPFELDPVWYCEAYPLAAIEVGQGDFRNLHEHFAGLGRLRGYSPTRPVTVGFGRFMLPV